MQAPKPMPPPAINDALQVRIIDGEVVFLGAGLGFSMTAAAAVETSRRIAALFQAGGDARL